MASDVRSALVDLMAATACLNGREAAVKKLSEMQLKGRYLQVKLTAFNIITVSLSYARFSLIRAANPRSLTISIRMCGADC